MKNYLLKPSKSIGKLKEEKEKEKNIQHQNQHQIQNQFQEKRKAAKSSEKILHKNKNNDLKNINIQPKKNKGKNLIKDLITSPKTIDYSQCK